MAERPKVEIFFKQLASTLIKRTGESVVVLLIAKSTDEAVTTECYETVDMLTGITAADLEGKCPDPETAAKAITYCMASAPKKIIISNLGWSETWKKLLSSGETNCVVTAINSGPGGSTTAQSIIRLANSGYGCMFVEKVENVLQHSTHYIALANGSYVKYYNEADEELGQYEIQGLYAGAIAACGTDRSLTNYTLPLIKNVTTTVPNLDIVSQGLVYAEMSAGKPRVVAGINTAEVSDEITEDMQHIEVIQTMDMIRKDISDTFVEYYRGAYKNNYNRQLLFIAAIKGYFTDLANEEVLDPNYENTCDVYVEAQRNAWLSYGKAEAESWSDDKVKLMSFGRKLFLIANIKICQSMEDLTMYIILE